MLFLFEHGIPAAKYGFINYSNDPFNVDTYFVEIVLATHEHVFLLYHVLFYLEELTDSRELLIAKLQYAFALGYEYNRDANKQASKVYTAQAEIS